VEDLIARVLMKSNTAVRAAVSRHTQRTLAFRISNNAKLNPLRGAEMAAWNGFFAFHEARRA
jgi:hypothetical protein